MSKGDKIRIDEEDLKTITANIKAPLIKVKQGILNPSFMVSITPTEEKDVLLKPKVEMVVEGGERMVKIVGQEEIKLLEDKMK